MIRAFLARLFAPPAPPEPESPSLRRRVADLESDLAYLAGDFQKLRGRVTGFIRKRSEEAPQDEPEEVEPIPRQEEAPRANGGTAHLSKRFRRW